MRRAVFAPGRLALAVLAVSLPMFASAAAFVPGRVEPDPPTGDEGASRPAGEEPAAGGNGIKWAFGRWRYRGDVALDMRWTRLEDGRQSTQWFTTGNIQFASYVWQPWFIQVRTGVGLMAGGNASGGGDGGSGSGGNFGMTGNAQVLVFPASRFPFELRGDVSDTRATGDTLVNHFRTYRLSLKQSYRPPASGDSYSLSIDHSRVKGSDDSSDVLTAVQGTAIWKWKDQLLDTIASFSDNTRDNSTGTRLWLLSGRHTYNPATALSVETVANWSRQQLEFSQGGTGSLSASSDIRQISTVANWRPRPGDWLYSETAPVTAAASARLAESDTGGGDAGRTRTYGVSGGVSKQFSPRIRMSGSASFNRVEFGGGAGNDLLALNGFASYTPESLPIGEWRYAPTFSTNLGYVQGSGEDPRTTVGLQGSHSLMRGWTLGPGQSVSFSASQGAGVSKTTNSPNAYGLSHGLGLSWQGSSESGTQTVASFTFNDSQTRAEGKGSFQFANIQLTRRSQLSRYSNWSASLTAQGSRSSADQIDAFTGELRPRDDGWQRAYSGSLTFDSQRVFNVPRLRFSALLTVNSQQLERRSLGDVDAPLERVSESLEARLDYTIGRLETRLAARAARIDGQSVYSITARAQRSF